MLQLVEGPVKTGQPHNLMNQNGLMWGRWERLSLEITTFAGTLLGLVEVSGATPLALFDMPNLNRFDILSISIFCKIALSISISISIFSKITISISISISIFLELPYRYRYRYRYFSELPYRYRYRYRYFQLLHIDIDIDIDIFQKCRYIDNRYFISIF